MKHCIFKKGRWTLMVSLLATTLLSCQKNSDDPGNTTTPDPVLTLVSDSLVTFPSEGGVGTLTYNIENPVEGVEISINCNTNWITNFTYSSANSITYEVAPSSSPDVRKGSIYMSYGDSKVTIQVEQDAYTEPEVEYDMEFEATMFNGSYYGRSGTSGFNYFVILSDMGAPNNSGYYYGSIQYRLDIYSEQTGFYDDRLPVGTYTFDSQDTGNPGTFGAEYSSFLDVRNELEQVFFVAGTITVTEDSIDAVLKLRNGQYHHVTYTGDMHPGYVEIDDDATMSAINQDYEFNITGGGMDCYYRGDYHGLGYDTWLINIVEDISTYSGEYLMFEVMVEKSASGINGSNFIGDYACYEYPSEEVLHTFIPGKLQDGFAPQASWYCRCNSGIIDNNHRAPLVGGTVSITQSGNTYTFTFDCVDDLGHTIKGTFSGSIRGAYDLSTGD